MSNKDRCSTCKFAHYSVIAENSPCYSCEEILESNAKHGEKLGYTNWKPVDATTENNGGTTDYYDVPEDAKTLNDLIDHTNMAWNIANIFKACYRLGKKDTASKIYDLNKIIYYANRELNLTKKEEA